MKITNAMKKQAKKELLILANSYEVKQRTKLVGIQYFEELGCAKWSGEAHDYTYWF